MVNAKCGEEMGDPAPIDEGPTAPVYLYAFRLPNAIYTVGGGGGHEITLLPVARRGVRWRAAGGGSDGPELCASRRAGANVLG
jgi:hypothetical protein